MLFEAIIPLVGGFATGAAASVSYGRIARLFRQRRLSRDVHIFVDLETLGTRHDAPVLVIAAVAVLPCGHEIASGQWRVDVDDAKKHGVACPETEAWWSRQSATAQDEAFRTVGPRYMLSDALQLLTNFVESVGAIAPEVGPLIWGNSPSFDCAILRHAYGAVGGRAPWEHWQERDCRTVAAIGKAIGYDAKKNTVFEGEPHVALHDARHQARYTTAVLNKVGGCV